MTLRSKHLAPIILAVFVAGIGGTIALNLWRTTSSKMPVAFQGGEFAGQANPADIRGSYTFGDISASFPVPVEALARAFGVESTAADPAAFQCKQLEEIYAGSEGGEIGTDSVRWFVALYSGMPYAPAQDTVLPASALEVLVDRLTPEQLAAARARTVGLSQAAPGPAFAASAVTAPEAPAVQPQVAAQPTAPESSTTHTEETVVGEIKGKTTFGELTSWGVSKEAIEAALGMPIGKPGVSVRDFCAENGIEFSTAKTALQELADAALGKR
jgi:hypothetical protein